jgi:hypothetical protein
VSCRRSAQCGIPLGKEQGGLPPLRKIGETIDLIVSDAAGEIGRRTSRARPRRELQRRDRGWRRAMGREATRDKQKPRCPGARKASIAVYSSQLRVVGACELCDVDHRQAGCFTPWFCGGAFKLAHTSTISAFGTLTARGAGLLSVRPAPKRNCSLRALRTPRPTHSAQNRLRFMCRRARVWRPASMSEYGDSKKTVLDPRHPPGRSLLR